MGFSLIVRLQLFHGMKYHLKNNLEKKNITQWDQFSSIIKYPILHPHKIASTTSPTRLKQDSNSAYLQGPIVQRRIVDALVPLVGRVGGLAHRQQV